MAEPTIGNVSWTTLYDAGLGTLPTSQGWTKTGSFSTESITGGRLRLTSSGSAYYTRAGGMPAVQSGKCLVVHLRAKLESGHVYTTGLEFGISGLSASQADYDRLLLNGSWSSWGNGIYAPKSFITALGNMADKNLLSGLAEFDLLVIWRLSGTTSGQTTHEVWYRPAGAYGVNSAKGYRHLFNVISFTGQNTNQVKLGDFYDAYGQDWSVTLVRAGWTSTAQVLSANGKELFGTVPDEATVDVTVSPASIGAGETAAAVATIGGDALATLNGSSWAGASTTVATGSPDPVPTIALAINDTTLDPGQAATITPTITGTLTATLAGSPLTNGVAATVATANTPTPPTIALAVSDTTLDPGQAVTVTPTITGSLTATLAGSPLVHGTPATVAAANVPPPATVAVVVSPDTVAPGETADASATTSGSVTLTLNGAPWDGTAAEVVAGSPVDVAIATSSSTVAPGETVTATTTPQTDVAVTINGAAITGTPQTIVTGTAGAGTDPPGSFSITPARWPGRFRLTTSEGGPMVITQPSTGSAALSEARLYRAPISDLADRALDATQATNPVAWGDLTWTGIPATATDHGWTMADGYAYWVGAVDADGRETLAGPVFGADGGIYQISVTGQLPTGEDGTCPWAGQAVTVVLDEAVELGGRQFQATGYRGTVQTDGSWTITGLPRLALATTVDGLTAADVAAEFRLPDGRTRLRRLLPDAATSAVGALTIAG